MATIVMDMSGYGTERDESVPENDGADGKHSGWHPELEIATELPAQERRRTIVEAGLVDADIDAFLDKMVRFQR